VVGIPFKIFVENIYEHAEAKSQQQIVTNSVPIICKLLTQDNVIWTSIPFGQLRASTYLFGQPAVSAFRAVLTDQQLNGLWSPLTGGGGGLNSIAFLEY
jgi:hypothetical protein